ncbi:RNA-directed DNA polymerase [Bacillus mycoides]|uniref:RNA-directed DNA polymerase n=1 Tax=Bacillus mycoides TaxID=1405 RepID=UPI001C00E421|nr:RNA-directed DNA polymerase [Bacillus mycoides]QWI60975.1 RNA-directed DNA polymerase [Bacillus mycoides]
MGKKYYEYMSELSSKELYEGLLGHGLFSDKLPPFLTSKGFLNYCNTHTPNFSNTKKEQSYIFYENMRNINIPRSLGIPTPMSYHRLCLHLESIWDKILDHFKNKTQHEKYKMSQIHIRKMKDNPKIFKMNYSDFKNDGTPELDLLIGSKYQVNADISTCFPSMYSHSITWALVGKEIAKQNKNNRNEWYNVLDFYVRNTKNGETNGLLIGPDASSILSEIILTSIDYELRNAGWDYIRNIDDYTCYVTSYEKGQRFLVELSEKLRAYDLILNHKKTQIRPLPLASVEHWVRKLGNYAKFNEKELINFKDVRSYLDLSIQLMQDNKNNAAILNFAIKVLSKKKMTANATEYVVKTIFHLAIIYPYLIPLLEENVLKAFKVESKMISKFATLIYKEGLNNNNFEAVSYAIYYSLKYGFVINELDFIAIRKSNHCILLLLAFLYCKHHKLSSEMKEFRKMANKLNTDDEDFNRNWLFVYEVLPKSSLKSDWRILKENDVTFVTAFE